MASKRDPYKDRFILVITEVMKVGAEAITQPHLYILLEGFTRFFNI